MKLQKLARKVFRNKKNPKIANFFFIFYWKIPKIEIYFNQITTNFWTIYPKFPIFSKNYKNWQEKFSEIKNSKIINLLFIFDWNILKIEIYFSQIITNFFNNSAKIANVKNPSITLQAESRIPQNPFKSLGIKNLETHSKNPSKIPQ